METRSPSRTVTVDAREISDSSKDDGRSKRDATDADSNVGYRFAGVIGDHASVENDRFSDRRGNTGWSGWKTLLRLSVSKRGVGTLRRGLPARLD